MTNQEILEIAMEQSAADLNCRAGDFLKNEPVVVGGGIGPGAKIPPTWFLTEITSLLL